MAIFVSLDANVREFEIRGLIIFRLGMLIIILLGGGLDDKRSRTEFHPTIYLCVLNK